jgi:hypothetical protein
MRLKDHVTLNFNNNMSMAAVFLDIEEAFDKTWHLGLLYKLSELKFLINLIKLLALSFLRETPEFRSKVNCLQQGTYKQGCHKDLSCPYINDTLKTAGVYLGLFADDTCIYATDCK